MTSSDHRQPRLPVALSAILTALVVLLTACGGTTAATYVASPASLAPSSSAPSSSASAAGGSSASSVGGSAVASAATGLRRVGHVFVIVLENENYRGAFSGTSYLAKTLPAKGQLLTQYYGIGHHSLDNYVAMISGQAPDQATQADCARYTNFAPAHPRLRAPGQAVGNGCVYPSSVKTVGDQLSAAGRSWRAYLEGMGTSCRHPRIGAIDTTRVPTRTNQYTTRHNPFMYFHSIIDKASCRTHDVGLTKLPAALKSASTTPRLSFIVPDLCDDAHEASCPDGRPGGMKAANLWLRTWVPRIMGSAAYKKDGMLVVTFDEADTTSTACCGEKPGPNSAKPGLTGPGGGRVGAVVLSRFVKPGTRNATPYNHYSLLATIESAFGLKRLGYAARARAFGADVLGR